MSNLLSISDLSRFDALAVLRMAQEMKADTRAALAEKRRPIAHLDGWTLASVFEKPSLRTRCSFEVGMFQLGGHAVTLQASETGRLGERESISDYARNLSRWVQIIQARVFSHEGLQELARWASVPVINGLSDFEHPTQIMADYLSILEHRGRCDDFHLAWIGDSNNVAHSLMVMACVMGTRLTLATPAEFAPGREIWALCESISHEAHDLIKTVVEPEEAVHDCDYLYTDTWVSMGMEAETTRRERLFKNYQINTALLAKAPAHAMVLHDMPAKRGREITDEILDGPRCLAFEQAENRLHTIKAILCWCSGVRF